MALVNGPLFSLDASGKLGNAVVYGKWKGRNYVREYVTPTNPKTLVQRLTRAGLAYLSATWAGLNSVDKNYWTAQGAARQISGFNAYTSASLVAWNQGQGMPNNPTDTPQSAPGTPTLTLDAAQTGRITGNLATPATGQPPVAGFIQLRLSSLTPTQTETVLFVPVTIGDTTDFTIPDLPAGNYEINANTMNDTGIFSTMAGNQSITVN